MRLVSIDFVNPPETPVLLGKRGDNRMAVLQFYVRDIIAQLGPEGQIALHLKPDADGGQTLVALQNNGHHASWCVSRGVTEKAGSGRLWLSYRNGGQLVRTSSIRFVVK